MRKCHTVKTCLIVIVRRGDVEAVFRLFGVNIPLSFFDVPTWRTLPAIVHYDSWSPVWISHIASGYFGVILSHIIEPLHCRRIIIQYFRALNNEVDKHTQNASLTDKPVGKLMFISINRAVHLAVSQLNDGADVNTETADHSGNKDSHYALTKIFI